MSSESEQWGWKHVSVFGGFDKGSGTKRWKCNHCNIRYNGSYSRVRAHLLGATGVGVKSCPAVDRSLREAFHLLEQERIAKKSKISSGNTRSAKRSRSSQSSLTCLWKPFTKEDVDDIVARCFFANGLSFSLARSPYFHDMVKAIAAFGPGYEAPVMEKLGSSLLGKEKGRIDKALLPVRESWAHTGCTILCVDGWTDTGSCPLLNILVSSPRGVVFLRSVDTSKEEKNEEFISNVLKSAILEVGPTHAVQIITDTTFVYKLAGTFIQTEFPQIFWTPCTSHALDLLLEDITGLDWMRPIVLCAKGVQQYILNHDALHAIFSQHSKLEHLKPIETKFASNFILVRRIVELKQALQQMVVSDDWNQWKVSFSEDGSSVEAAILGSEFWIGATLMLKICEPFVKMLRLVDGDKPCMGDIYEGWNQALQTVKASGIDDALYKQLQQIIENRWEILLSPLHATGYILNPRHFGKGQAKDKDVMRGWKITLDRYGCDATQRRILREQLSAYWRQDGSLGEEDAIDCRDKMDPVAWWENFGSETPQLQTLAIRILSQISSIASFQGNWCTYDFIHSEKRNKLGTEKVDDLIYIHYNLRLLSRRYSNYLSGVTRMWDMDEIDQGNYDVHNNLAIVPTLQ
eukprot:Gb_00740 [translate_table: standard]